MDLETGDQPRYMKIVYPTGDRQENPTSFSGWQ